jgi:hypothetical protein
MYQTPRKTRTSKTQKSRREIKKKKQGLKSMNYKPKITIQRIIERKICFFEKTKHD